MALMMFVFVRSRPARKTCPDRTPRRSCSPSSPARPTASSSSMSRIALGRQLPAVGLGRGGVGEVPHAVDGDQRDLRVACPTWPHGCPTRSDPESRTARGARRRADEGSYAVGRVRLGHAVTRSTHPADAGIERRRPARRRPRTMRLSCHIAGWPAPPSPRRRDRQRSGQQRLGAAELGRAWPRPRPDRRRRSRSPRSAGRRGGAPGARCSWRGPPARRR